MKTRHSTLILCVALVLVGQVSWAQTCEDLKKKLDDLIKRSNDITNELHQPGLSSDDKSALQTALQKVGREIFDTRQKLQQCLQPPPCNAGHACEGLQKKLDDLNKRSTEITNELHQPGLSSDDKSALQTALQKVGSEIFKTRRDIAICQHPPALAPQRILGITTRNPGFDRTGDWAREVATGTSDPNSDKTFPDVDKEWIQALRPDEDYDDPPMGAVGWVIHPRVSQVDFPFDHPFNFDWEFSLAPDPGPYDFLLAPGNVGTIAHQEQLEDEVHADALRLSHCKGLLGIEMDAGLIPDAFIAGVSEGNRVATFGRWIVDAGHENYRAEIHPPLLMAAAAPTADGGTRILLTSRPYLVGQTYTLQTGLINTIYDDAAADDGPFYSHLTQEIKKVILHQSLQLEAHPKIKSRPFLGSQQLHFTVRPASTPIHPTALSPLLAVSFHFTVRSGCTVHVNSSAPDTIDVFILLNQSGYHPPPLPPRTERTYSLGEILASAPSGSGARILSSVDLAQAVGALTHLLVLAPVVDHIFESGVKTDVYASQSGVVDLLSRNNAVESVSPSNIPPGKGVTVNDGQPYPIFGWLELKWVPPEAHP